MASAITASTDPLVDRWLRCHRPRTELTLRYSMCGQFDAAKHSANFNARIQELFAAIHPSENEYAAIQRGACVIGAAVAQLLDC
jgi:hypothetical protein